MSVAVSEAEQVNGHGVVYAGTEPSAIFRSEDRGDSWLELAELRKLPSAPTWSFPPRPWTSHIRWITPDPLVPGRIFAAAEAGALIRSLDGGQTWEDRKPSGPFDTHTLIMHRLAPGRLYSAAGDGFRKPGNGFVQSEDAGENWYRPRHARSISGSWSARSPRSAIRRVGNLSAVRKKPWRKVHEGLPSSGGMLASVVAANRFEPGVFYLANNIGVFRSANAGLTWDELPIPWPREIKRANGLTVAAGG